MVQSKSIQFSVLALLFQFTLYICEMLIDSFLLKYVHFTFFYSVKRKDSIN